MIVIEPGVIIDRSGEGAIFFSFWVVVLKELIRKSAYHCHVPPILRAAKKYSKANHPLKECRQSVSFYNGTICKGRVLG
jgi:hypothetical protein